MMNGLQKPAVHHLHEVVVLSSTDEEEANRDLTLDILERARRCREKRQVTKKNKRKKSKKKAEYDGVVVDLITTSSDESEVSRKSKRRKKRIKKLEKSAKNHQIVVLDAVDGDKGVVRHGLKEEAEAKPLVDEPQSQPPPNEVFRKLLRIPRYFDSEGSNIKFCSNCNEDGHVAANCRLERRKKPCFVCGIFGHDARKCPQGYDCYMCKGRGHLVKNCPDKVKNTHQKNSKFCLRCGDLGHDMIRCINGYDSEDLKEIQCYVCKRFGHLCCMDATGTDVGSAVVACYNCGLTGHSGLGCCNNKVHLQTKTVDSSPKSCYKCGEEGHFARGCSKKVKGSSSKVRSQTSIGDSRTMCFRCGSEGHLKRDCPKKQKSDKILDEPKTPFTNPRILRNGDHFESRSAPPNKRYNDGGSFGHDDRVNFQYHDIKNHDEWRRLSSSHRNSQYGRGYISSPPSLYSDVNRQMAVNYRVNPHYQPDFGRNYHNYHPDAGYRAVPRFNNNPANRHWN